VVTECGGLSTQNRDLSSFERGIVADPSGQVLAVGQVGSIESLPELKVNSRRAQAVHNMRQWDSEIMLRLKNHVGD
jgi:hypothetical protein